ncbi:hypothetical protein SAY86_013195 [Trapa natans]|uniref:Uncharacterized protein n=1 Tax=Trapa natans TaxID=22666 RepID=A0AAN7MFB8_TRANT|nr:hypothetical protein SAY86_013195 [Trapa natans]
MSSTKFHFVMFPWFAVGHMTPYLHLSNRLAERGHKITFLLPKKILSLLQPLNSQPHLIAFHSITIPHVDGLPPGAETASDIPISSVSRLAAAFDLTRDQFEVIVAAEKPDFVFYDTAHWVPEIARRLGIRSVCYNAVCAAAIAIALVPARAVRDDRPLTREELAEPPSGYPSKTVVLRPHEVESLTFISLPFGDGITFYARTMTSMKHSDAIAMRTCREIEGAFCDYLSSQFDRPVLLTGPVLPEQSPDTKLDERWACWLGKFSPGSVIFCAFGTQFILEKDQFQELLLGFEETNMPFLVALKPPAGATTVEEALPQGFEERTKGRGIVYGGWVQQPLIIGHRSVGCFVNHCGFGSMWESLMCDCQLVMVPHLGDQILNTRLLTEELKVGVEVERQENGWFSKESLCKAVRSVMDKDSELGASLRKNHAHWKSVLTSSDRMSGYIDQFIRDLQEIGR